MDKPSTLRTARERKGLQQSDIAIRLAVTQATVSNWENGKAQPSPAKWKSISRSYGLTLAKVIHYFSTERAEGKAA